MYGGRYERPSGPMCHLRTGGWPRVDAVTLNRAASTVRGNQRGVGTLKSPPRNVVGCGRLAPCLCRSRVLFTATYRGSRTFPLLGGARLNVRTCKCECVGVLVLPESVISFGCPGL